MFPDLFRTSLQTCLTVLRARPTWSSFPCFSVFPWSPFQCFFRFLCFFGEGIWGLKKGKTLKQGNGASFGPKKRRKWQKSRETALFSANPRFLGKKPGKGDQGCLECRKWGFKRWGLKQIRGYLKKKAFSCVFWIFQVLYGPSGKGRKGAEKGRKRPISADFQDGRPDTP